METIDFKNKIIVGDCLEKLKQFPNDSIDCCITSPPYWGLRDYGVDNQLGNENDFYDFVSNLINVFKEVKRVLKPTGTCFVNMGDTYGGNGGRNKRTVWSINTKPFRDAHFATYPEELVGIMVKYGCPEGGIVLDPFMGAGTTAIVAKKLNRDYVGIELNPEYLKIAENRINKEFGFFL